MAEKGKITTVITPSFRAAFVQVFEAKAFSAGDEPKYSITMLFPKATNLDALKALAKDAAHAKFGAGVDMRTLKNPFRDGDTDRLAYESFKGMIFINASTKTRPGLVDANLNPIISREAFYSGCWARATVSAYGFDFRGNKGVAFGLSNLQKLRDDEPFAGRPKAEDEFTKADDAFAGDSSSGPGEAQPWD